MTTITMQRPRAATLTRTSFLAAPALIGVYGVIRLLTSHGPGAGWTMSHLAFLAGALLFGPVLVALRGPAAARTRGRSIAVNLATGIAFLGLAATAAQVTIDLIVGLRATDRPGMNDLFDTVQNVPGVMLAVYSVGPALFYLGLLALVTILAVGEQRCAPFWSPFLVVLGTALPLVTLDLLPLAGVCFLLALTPLRRTLTQATV